jgi:hypothetical protein
MISNIADGTGARILSNDEIDAVAGGCGACWVALGAAAVFAGAAAYAGYNAARDNAPGTLANNGGDHLVDRTSSTATESGPIGLE